MKRSNASAEEYGRNLIAHEIGKEVLLHDDGSRPSMYDLRVGTVQAPEIAIECIGAVDPTWTATWNEGPARGSFSYRLRSDWHVVLTPTARVRLVRESIERVLQDFEAEGRLGFTRVDWRLKRERFDLFEHLSALRIESISCISPDGTGSVDFGMPSIGGSIDNTGSSVPAWLFEFLSHPARSDVLSKLKNSGAAECHVLIHVSFGAVPWSVESYLGTFPRSLPGDSPNLPPPVAQVWIVYGGRCIRWGGESWSDFATQIEPNGHDAA